MTKQNLSKSTQTQTQTQTHKHTHTHKHTNTQNTLVSFSIDGNPLMQATPEDYLNFAFDYSAQAILQRVNYTCARPILKKHECLQFEASPAYFDYVHCKCSVGFFGTPPDE